MKAFAQFIVYSYIIMTAVLLFSLGVLCMFPLFISGFFRPVEHADFTMFLVGVCFVSLAAIFFYGSVEYERAPATEQEPTPAYTYESSPMHQPIEGALA